MSIATALLLVGAVGIMLVMHFVGHGGHSPSHGAQETQGAEVTPSPERGDSAGAEKPAHRGHGCC